jgi:tetratricopeptide (TPR) repeat protein
VTAALSSRRPAARWLAAALAFLLLIMGAAMWTLRGTPAEPVRLAVLPFQIEGEPLPSAAAIGSDIADRLSGARRNFVVISPAEILRAQADTPAKARSILGATHLLITRLRHVEGRLTASAIVSDAATGQKLRELTGEYAAGDALVIARALVATLSRAFHLPGAAVRETVSAAAYPHFVRGLALIRRDTASADEALPFFRKAVELDPKSALPWAGLAEAQLQKFVSGAGEEWLLAADESVARAASINSDAVPVLLASGVVAQTRGNYEQALADLSRATDLEPDNADSWRRLAYVYQRTNRTGDAVAAYRKAIDLQPNDYRHYENLAGLYFQRNDYAQAEEMDRRVVSIAPGLAAGHMNLALALLRQNKFAEAEQSMLTALRLRRTAPGLMNLGALYYAQERYEDALRLFREGLAAGPPTPVRYRNAGDALRHLGRNREAQDAYRKGVDLAESEVSRNPREAAPRALLALMLAHAGESRRALSEVAQALAMEPENAIAMRDAVLALETMGQRERSLEVLRRAPASLIGELSRQPDVKNLQQDARFRSMMLRKEPGP